ncbi:hypothetical protein ACRCPS_17755 [Pseudomonas aeruginosa]
MESARVSRVEEPQYASSAGKGLRLSAIELAISGLGASAESTAVPRAVRQANRLRLKDRGFASIGGDANELLWFEIVSFIDEGYQAKCLSSPEGEVFQLDLAGAGTLGGEPVAVEAIDAGYRINPGRWPEVLDTYKAFRSLGLTLPLALFEQQMRVSTNQIHLNAHPQAIATLTLGQYFVCGQDVWLVIENGRDAIAGQRMSDLSTATFTRKGQCTSNSTLMIEASIMSEADYDHDGWRHEIDALGGVIPAHPLFDMSPGALSGVRPGAHLLLSALMTGRESVWEVVTVSESSAEIRHGSDTGSIDFSTGRGEGAAVSASFRAVIVTPRWCHGDLGAMFQKTLLFA